MSNAIALRPETPAPVSFADIEKMGESIAKSGLFGMRTKDQAVALLLLSHAEGKHPVIAARDYDIISGKPAKKAEAMQRDFMLAGGKIEWHELTDTKAEATFSHPIGGTLRLDWTPDRAKKAGLGGKDNWQKFTRAMLRARLLTEGIRSVYPAATGGLVSTEEAADVTDRPMTDVTPKSDGAAAKLEALAKEAEPPAAEQPKPNGNHYPLDLCDGSDVTVYTGADWLVQAEIALNSHPDPALFWKANEAVFYQIQEAAQKAGAKKGLAACGRVADLVHAALQ